MALHLSIKNAGESTCLASYNNSVQVIESLKALCQLRVAIPGTRTPEFALWSFISMRSATMVFITRIRKRSRLKNNVYKCTGTAFIVHHSVPFERMLEIANE